MPPVNSQSSRGGLVAAVVVFTILFVTATIFAIYFGVQYSKKDEEVIAITQRYRQIVGNMEAPPVATLIREATTDKQLQDQTALSEAIRQRDEMRKMISGTVAPTTQAANLETRRQADEVIGRARDAVSRANLALGSSNGSVATSDNLVQTIALMTDTVTRLSGAVRSAQADRDQARAEADKQTQASIAAQTAARAAAQGAAEAISQANAAAAVAIQHANDDATGVKGTFSDESKTLRDQVSDRDKQIALRDGQIDELNNKLDSAMKKMAARRPAVDRVMVERQAGQIIRVTDANTVYIDLGRSNQIVPGMTFEVYDKGQPLPTMTNGTADENMPVGKGSIEVIHVLNNSSECHVNRIATAQQFVEGDRLVNIAYDPNIKFNFYVYGLFDPTHSGRASAAGADVIKRLVTQNGSSVVNDLGPNTDFVVMGAPVDVPTYTQAELASDPLKQEELANARDAAARYDTVLNTAEKLHLTILNQNRFFYYIGYYDIAQR